MKQTLLAASMLAALPLVSQADVVISNLGEPPRDTTEISTALWAAQSFSTGASGGALTAIDLVLGNLLGTPGIVAELRAASGSSLGVTLTALNFGSVTSAAPVVTAFTPASAVNLAPNTTYWIVMGASGAGSFGWTYAEGNGSTGAGALLQYAYSSDLGANWDAFGTDNPYYVQVSVSAVPEPASAWLLLAGAALLAAARRSRAT